MISVKIRELRKLYSQVWDGYAFMTHVVHDPISHDMSYWRALQDQASGVPFGGPESDRSDPFVV